MVGKIWKKLGFFILIVACIFNIMFKIVKKTPFLEELTSSVQYMEQVEEKKEK